MSSCSVTFYGLDVPRPYRFTTGRVVKRLGWRCDGSRIVVARGGGVKHCALTRLVDRVEGCVMPIVYWPIDAAKGKPWQIKIAALLLSIVWTLPAFWLVMSVLVWPMFLGLIYDAIEQ